MATAFRVMARMNGEGTFRFGEENLSTGFLGEFVEFVAIGDGTLPKSAPNPATLIELNDWIDSLRVAGFEVDVTPTKHRKV
jgi:hypothetical protein